METVLVTGGSGFVGTHLIARLLADGASVRTTMRDLGREGELRAALGRAGVDPGERLSVVAADLSTDAGWPVAVRGCTYVHHVASPFPAGVPKDDEELIAPARDGALRVLRAARDAGVRRVVLTSSFAAIGYGHGGRTAPFTETDWTDLDGDGDVPAYPKSKTIAERAAWGFVAEEGNGLELAVVNPVAIFGPTLTEDLSTSLVLIKRLMDGSMPGTPRIYFGVVDVRDVADLHVRAMRDPAAAGQRFLAVEGPSLSVADMAAILRRRMPEFAGKLPKRQLPDILFRIMGLFDPAVRTIVPNLGKKREASGEKARRLLGWSPRSSEDAVVATAESLVRLSVV